MKKLLLVFAFLAIAACTNPVDLQEGPCPEGADPDPNSLCDGG